MYSSWLGGGVARRIRLLRKKRGDRVSGSARWSAAGEGLFFGCCLVLGAIATVMIVRQVVVPQWRVRREFVAAPCRVLAAPTVDVRQEDEGESYRPLIPFQYKVGDRTYRADRYDLMQTWFADREAAEEIASRFQEGETYQCWYDPQRPGTAVLEPTLRWTVWLLLLLPVAFLAIGLGGLAYTVWQTSTSRERRAARASKVGGESNAAAGDGPAKYPTVPGTDDLNDSPGTTLAYRLPIALTPGWQLFSLATACLFWNGLVIVLLVLAINNHLAGRPDWILTVLVLPFAVFGGWLVMHWVRQLLKTTGIGPTRIELSGHPLVPGDRFELFLSQSGRLRVQALEVTLVCEEQATFRQGTDSVTDTREVRADPVVLRNNFEVRPGAPYELRCTLAVPAEAMHSFRSAHNSVHWKLRVRGQVARWDCYERSFPVIVRPTGGELKEPQKATPNG